MLREKLIIRLLIKNDERAISMLYDDYATALYGVVFRIVLSEKIAEDVMQDAFVKIWKNGQYYNSSKGTLFTWVLNICRNKAIDATRSKHYRGNGKVQNFEQTVVKKTKPFYEININQIGLREQVNKLEEKYRIIIELLYFQGHTQKEVEQKLNIPLGTVKSRLKIGLKALQKVYRETIKFIIFIFLN